MGKGEREGDGRGKGKERKRKEGMFNCCGLFEIRSWLRHWLTALQLLGYRPILYTRLTIDKLALLSQTAVNYKDAPFRP